MRISKTLNADDTTGYIVDLRAEGDTASPFNQVGSVVATTQKTGVAESEIWVKFISVRLGGTPPAAPSATPAPAVGDAADWVQLRSDGKTSTAWGDRYGLGWNTGAQGIVAPATHVLIWSETLGNVVIEAQ